MLGILDTALIAAIVSAAVTALGWFASHWSERRLEAQRRAEKIIDVQWALLAEIESNLLRYAEIDLDEHEAEMERRILKSGRTGFTPFVPRDPAEIIFDAFIPDIHILPTETIRDVVSYYKQEYKLRELIDDLRSERYLKLAPDRKALLYSDYVWQIKSVVAKGEKARAALADQLNLAGPAPSFNSRDAVPSRASGN